MRVYLLLLAALCFCTNAFSQEFSYTHYDVKDGLAGSIVYSAAEDKEGFLWFGTETGLSRFDGTHFRNFTTADGLPDNEVLKLFVDSKNRVWMGLFKNSVCYYWKGRIYNTDNDSTLRHVSVSSDVYAISEDRYGNIIILDRMAINIIYASGQVKKIDSANGEPMLNMNAGLDRYKRYVFLSTPGSGPKLCTIDARDPHPIPVLLANANMSPQISTNTALFSPQLNVLWENNSRHLKVFPADGKAFSLAVPENMICITKAGDNFLAINTGSGSFLYDCTTAKKLAHFLVGRAVNNLIRDSEGNFWLMCAGSGIFRIGSLAFRSIQFPVNGTGLSVSAIQKNEGSLLVGTEKGRIWAVDTLLRKYRPLQLHGFTSTFARVTAIIPNGKDRLLVGTDDNIIDLVHFTQRYNKHGMSTKAIARVNDNTWLVSSFHMAILYHVPGFIITDTVWHGRSTSLYIKDSLFYIGTLNGLYTVSMDKKIRFLGDIDPVFKRRISSIKETPDGIIWVATYGQGVAGYKNNRLLYMLTDKQGLTSNICRTLAVSGNEIWVGTDKGLNKVRLRHNGFEVTRFSMADGLNSDMINTVYADGNNIYVGTAAGLTYFNVSNIATQSFCKLRVTAVQTPRHSWAYDTTGLLLPHQENSIRIEFAGISFRSAGDIVYQYRLRGLSDAWHTTRETFVSYPALPSGMYTLELVAINKFDVHSREVQVQFTVSKLLWEENWFIALMAVLAGALLWLLVSMRIRRIKKKNQEKLNTNARIAELEQRALKAQMNPHFIFNSLNSIQQYVIDKDFKGVNKFITDFSRLIRLTLEMSSKNRISVEEEIKYLSTYLELEKTRFENKFDYLVQLQPGIDPLACYIPPMILQPYVENSIRHGVRNRDDNDGKITISFVKDDQYLVCIIHDNGVGRKEAQKFKSQSPIEYQSRGMALTASRVEMINKTNAAAILIDIEDGQTEEDLAAGTRVLIRFPLKEIIKPTSFYDQGTHYR